LFSRALPKVGITVHSETTTLAESEAQKELGSGDAQFVVSEDLENQHHEIVGALVANSDEEKVESVAESVVEAADDETYSTLH